MTEPWVDDARDTTVFTVETNGSIVSATANFAHLFGTTTSESVGLSLTDLVASPDRPRVLELITGPQSGLGVTVCGRRVDGLPLVVSLSRVSDEPNADGSQSLVAIRWGGRVEWADVATVPPTVARGGLDHVLSHDARGALRNAASFAGVVGRTVLKTADPEADPDDGPAEYLEIVRRSIDIADELLDQSVRYLRLEPCTLSMRRTPINDVLAAAVQSSDRDFADAALEVSYSFEDCSVIGDVELLSWLFGELFTNARKLGATSCTASLSNYSNDETDDHDLAPWIELSVADDGPGIDPSLASDAFRPGRMLQPRGHHAGVGMGLAIAKLVARRHGGDVWFDTEPSADAGATVRVRLLRGDQA